MERCLKKHGKEYMKMVMLKQEETFRYQVHELHRLHQTQMLLMQRYTKDKRALNQNKGEMLMPETDEESHLELTLATGSSQARSKKKDASFTSDSGSSFSSSSNESELTKQYSNEWAPLKGPDMITSFRNRKDVLEIEEQIRQDELKQTPWLLKCSKPDMVASFGM
ncbi:hypothetical protein Cni_G01031 [Canna indica]|uniref:Uncharacterized protein n=1 Tax=Canna indica TaxID=4628 RepID=A0AAQ3PXL9_9LILI|nr:hypothetical protein Cni_G01031 [Canna indica]